MREGMPDLDAVYQAEDIRDGWDPGTSVVIADLYENDGAPLPMCGRSPRSCHGRGRNSAP